MQMAMPRDTTSIINHSSSRFKLLLPILPISMPPVHQNVPGLFTPVGIFLLRLDHFEFLMWSNLFPRHLKFLQNLSRFFQARHSAISPLHCPAAALL